MSPTNEGAVYPETAPFELPAGVEELFKERMSDFRDGTAVLLPVRLDGGIGQYRAELLTAPKELRAAGAPVEFLQAPNERTGLSEFSAGEVALVFAFGVVQNMTWDAAKLLWSYMHARSSNHQSGGEPPLVRVEVARIRRGDLKVDGLSITGPANDGTALAVLRALTGDATGEVSGRESGEG